MYIEQNSLTNHNRKQFTNLILHGNFTQDDQISNLLFLEDDRLLPFRIET